MSPVCTIIEGRDREAEAAVLALSAPQALRAAGDPAWLFGSLASGEFLSHSDIDIPVDATGVAKDGAISVCLRASKGLPWSIVFSGGPASAYASSFSGGSNRWTPRSRLLALETCGDGGRFQKKGGRCC